MKFEDFGLTEAILRGVRKQGYCKATPIQAKAIPAILRGRDLMGCAQTGTGKTAAFALPTLQRLSSRPMDRVAKRGHARSRSTRPIRSLILAPTRELAIQIHASFQAYGKFTGMRATVIYGGVSQHRQVRSLQDGVDIVIATPGRLLDLMQQGHVDLASVQLLILDEADQMLDMGFIHDLRKIVARVPKRRQTLMFSATMPGEIRKLADQWLSDPVHVRVAPVAAPAEKVQQSVYFVEPPEKSRLLKSFLRQTPGSRTLVFTRTKRGADRVARQLTQAGIVASAIHGNKSQNLRERVLARFKSSQPPVLVATDIAARGLDVREVSHVINFDLPEVPEIYVHRIGRTGRAGAAGRAISFCGRDERSRLRRIERLTRRAIEVEPSHALP